MTGDETGLTSQLISTPSLPTQPMKGCTTPSGSTTPTLYEQQCGFLYVSQRIRTVKEASETGPKVFRPHPRRLECLTISRCPNKGSTFSSVILRPWVLAQPLRLAGVESRDLPLSRPALIQLSQLGGGNETEHNKTRYEMNYSGIKFLLTLK